MGDMELYPFDLSSTDSVERLSSILESHLPFSLPVIGSLHCTHDNLSSVKSSAPSLYAWTTFKISSTSEIPPLFTVVVYSPIFAHQLRIFCSAESSPHPPTRDEEDHVIGATRALLDALKDNDHKIIQGLDVQSMLKTPVNGAPPSIHMGSVHSKWVSCLRQYSVAHIGCCLKFFREPQSRSQSVDWDEPTDEWIVSQLEEKDIELVRSRASFPRTHEFVASRCSWSVCIRQKGGDGSAIAWQILCPDGTLGMLHVQPEYRRKGLARLCIAALCRKLESMFATEDEGKVNRYPYARWEFLDVVKGNEKSLRLIASLGGWSTDTLWDNYWIYLPIERGDRSGRVSNSQ